MTALIKPVFRTGCRILHCGEQQAEVAMPNPFGRPRTPIDIRFWRFVEKTDTCWPWIGHRDKLGYGRFTDLPGRSSAAHRVSYTLHYSVIPHGFDVCHHCDMRHCVRPSHLFLGTAQDNIRDAAQKGRMPRGERSANVKLTTALVEEIRSLSGVLSQRDIAKRFDLTQKYVWQLLHRKFWKHI